jgi:hypothetical protein
MTSQHPPENGRVEVEIDFPQDPRDRTTVGFRYLFLIPQFIALVVLGVCAVVTAVLGWFGALFTGRLPQWAREYLVDYTVYTTRVHAFSMLITDEYPPFAFTDPEHPVQFDFPDPGRLDRAAVFFRFVLCVPAALVMQALTYGWAIISFFVWLTVLITGRTPVPVFDAVSATIRYTVRFNAYANMITASYPNPKQLFGDTQPDAAEQRSRTRPLILSTGGRRLLITMIVLGAVGFVGYELFNDLYLQPMLQHTTLHHAH